MTGRRLPSCACTPPSSCGAAHLPLTRILNDLLLVARSRRVRCPFGSSALHLSYCFRPVMFQRCLGPEHDLKRLPWLRRPFFDEDARVAITSNGRMLLWTYSATDVIAPFMKHLVQSIGSRKYASSSSSSSDLWSLSTRSLSCSSSSSRSCT